MIVSLFEEGKNPEWYIVHTYWFDWCEKVRQKGRLQALFEKDASVFWAVQFNVKLYVLSCSVSQLWIYVGRLFTKVYNLTEF